MRIPALPAIAVASGLAAAIAAIAAGRAPKWLRVSLVVAAAAIAAGGGLYGYRFMTTPTVLTLAVGSVDGDASKIMSAIGSRMASNNLPVRLKVVEKASVKDATQAFSAGEVDMAIVRGDGENLSSARALLLVTYGVVLILAPAESKAAGIEDLKGKTIRVVGGDVNRPIIDALTGELDLARAKIQFKDVKFADLQGALASKQVGALLLVTPVSEKYLAILRTIFSGKHKLVLVPIESAGGIEAASKTYESYDLPKGVIKGSPAIPSDDLTTLRVPFYLVINKKVDDDVAGAVTKAIMDTRRDLISEYPVLSQLDAPSTDADAQIPIHSGAAAFFGGTQKTIFEKYGDQITYGSMVLGALGSVAAAAWKFMTSDTDKPENRPLNRLNALIARIRTARTEDELAEIEKSIDEIMGGELDRYADGTADASTAAAMSVATRLDNLIALQRAAIVAR